MSHTSAPWIVADDGTVEAKFSGLVGHLADASQADARLIAAAPELLEALQRVEALAEYAKDNPRRQTDKLFDILETVRAVIAKATGGAL